MPISISIRADIKGISRTLDNLAYKQLPFATATALTSLAQRVKSAEQKAIEQTFPTATPFTRNSIGVIAARKSNLTATVFMKDIAAAYLEPFEFGGPHFLGKKHGLLNPRHIPVNAYGNLPKGKLAALKGRPDIFIGPVKTKKGIVNGVWQRPASQVKAPVGQRKPRLANPNKTERLVLLIRFTDPQEVKQRLGYRARAERTVRTWFKPEFTAAMRKALKTARA